MDLTILYRVLWKPNEVFKEIIGKFRVEPFIFICAAVAIPLIAAYKSDYRQLIEQPDLILIGLFRGFFIALLFPGLNAIIIFAIAKTAFDSKASFWPLLSAFILCGLPFYISTWLKMFFGYPAIYVGLGALSPSLAQTHPFLFGILASITPFFIWVVILWRSALTRLLATSKRQTAVLLSVLILLGLTVGGLWRMFAVMMFNLFNPAI